MKSAEGRDGNDRLGDGQIIALTGYGSQTGSITGANSIPYVPRPDYRDVG